MKALLFFFSVVLGMLASTDSVPAACTPGSCNDNDPCTTDTCDPVQGCIFTPVSCDDGNACTADSCSPVPAPGPATLFIGHDTRRIENEFNKIGTLAQTWGALGSATGAAQDGNAVYVVNPNYGNNVIERRGPGNTNLGTITATFNQFIEDMGNFVPGSILASAFGGGIYSINTSNGASTLLFTTGTNLVGVTYDGTNIWTTGGNTVYRRNLSGTILATFTTSMANNAIGYDPDDGTLWIGHAMGVVTHHTQSGTNIGGFTTFSTDNFIDGVELIRMPIAAGCRNTPLDCNDSDPCTDDACNPMTGCYHPTHSCDDSNPCTDEACFQQTGCVYTFNAGPCDDSNLCTVGDTCDNNGMCQPGPTNTCNGNNVCTDDFCDPRTGCYHTDNTNFCNDGNACTVEDFCANGTCQPGFPLVCNDGNACTADSCVPANGCVYSPQPNGTTCDDGNACTNGDVCVNGTCHGAPLICPAPDQCHLAGGCDPASGSCSNPPAPNGTACNDGNPCTASDVCTNGVCGGGLIAIPGETHGLTAGSDKATYTWSPNLEATAYDAVRGGTLPVGGSSTETCFSNMTSAKLVDAASPAPGTVFWYLSRARNPCGFGPWGTQSDGTARATGACP